MIRDKKFYSIIFICFLLGFMISVQVRTAQENVKTSTQYQRIEKLSDMLWRTEIRRAGLNDRTDQNFQKSTTYGINHYCNQNSDKGNR